MTRFRPKLLIAGAAVLIAFGAVAYFLLRTTSTPDQPKAPPTIQPKIDEPVAFNNSLHSLDEPSSVWVIVNKKRPLPATYTPESLTPLGGASLQADAATALTKLLSGAKKEGISLKVISGYRSYASQQSVYSGYVQTDGQANADTYSARPGHSEHQTGLAADLGNASGNCDLEICFGTTPGGVWLAAHAHEYGFIIRYAEDKTPITGYQYEPWHIRYVGSELSAELHKAPQPMEEFFGLPAAPNY
jgi:D-alanyl-D-alanine carboxypeptidase